MNGKAEGNETLSAPGTTLLEQHAMPIALLLDQGSSSLGMLIVETSIERIFGACVSHISHE